jgi:hypothetical protein
MRQSTDIKSCVDGSNTWDLSLGFWVGQALTS